MLANKEKELTVDWQSLPLLHGKTIVVTGCASGIGLETAKLVTRMGGRVLGVDVNDCAADLDEFFYADLSDAASINNLVAALPKGIDGLANIAGLAPPKSADLVVKVNFVAIKILTTGLIDKFNDGASIVNLASLAGEGWRRSINKSRELDSLTMDQVAEFLKRHEISNVGAKSYFFSKEALIAWTMRNRWTWRDRGIRVNAVSPGPVDTGLLPDFLASVGDDGVSKMTPMDRAGSVEDVAPVVAFLLSDMTHWIRGANIPVCGGMLADMLCKTDES